MAYQSVSPFTGDVLERFDQHTDAQVESAVATAECSFHNMWSTATFRDRARIVGRAAALMLERKEVLAAWQPSRWGSGSRKPAKNWT